MRIARETTIEALLAEVPGVVRFLIERGLPCLVCGEPTWGTLEELARRNGRSDAEIDRMIAAMEELREQRSP
jgi:hypothetical protein